MMTTRRLASLMMLLALAGWAKGQGSLGSPIRHDEGVSAPVVQATLVVHENGRSIRCRLLETWQLSDGRMAQLVEAMQTGELITLLSEPAVQPADGRTMPTRIFLWGAGRRFPPEGSPIPPRLAAQMPPMIPTSYRNPLISPAMLPDPPSRAEIEKMATDGNHSPAEITAAKVLLDETQAKARQAAVRYLATVDCHYYPEAEASLIAALRADRSELVRLEAAQNLAYCRGVTVRILDALHLSASGQESDGNPGETSERVRYAARMSLNRLLATGMSMDQPAPAPTSIAVINNWPAPPQAQPVAAEHAVPLALPPALPEPIGLTQQRQLAASVSTQARPTTHHMRPTVYGLLLNWLGRDTGTPSQPGVDPRLRGMRPLSSADSLSIQR
jgi:hypothetical protein